MAGEEDTGRRWGAESGTAGHEPEEDGEDDADDGDCEGERILAFGAAASHHDFVPGIVIGFNGLVQWLDVAGGFGVAFAFLGIDKPLGGGMDFVGIADGLPMERVIRNRCGQDFRIIAVGFVVLADPVEKARALAAEEVKRKSGGSSNV